MDVYGNKTWNNATDNRDKSVIPMAEDTFRKIQAQLENSGINYYAYSKDSKTVMAVNDKDLEWFRSIVGKDADKMEIRKSDVVYVPPQKNIIGNAEYRYIPQKKYLSLDSDTALKMAEIMDKQSIQFSGRVSANGKTTLTISQPDFEKVGKMPVEERGQIGNIKPSGWHTVKYDNVDGKYLYNRCHLIGYQLSGENANENNLITGTRYLNTIGMLPFENLIAEYVNETNNHVLYRVTPIFDEDIYHG